MHGGQDQAAAGQVLAHQLAEPGAPCGVQRRQRLVQQPERARAGDQPGQGQAAALAGGQLAHLQVAGDRGPGWPQAASALALVPPRPLHLEQQLLPGRAAGFQPVLVAQQVQVGGAGVLGRDGTGGVRERQSPPPQAG